MFFLCTCIFPSEMFLFQRKLVQKHLWKRFLNKRNWRIFLLSEFYPAVFSSYFLDPPHSIFFIFIFPFMFLYIILPFTDVILFQVWLFLPLLSKKPSLFASVIPTRRHLFPVQLISRALLFRLLSLCYFSIYFVQWTEEII